MKIIKKEMSSISDILGHDVTVEAVGGKRIPYEGVVKLWIRLNGRSIEVPFLVTNENVESPIIGTNVIKCLVSDSDDQVSMLKSILDKAEES